MPVIYRYNIGSLLLNRQQRTMPTVTPEIRPLMINIEVNVIHTYTVIKLKRLLLCIVNEKS